MNESAGAIWKWIGELRKSQEVQGQIPMLIRGRSELNSGAAHRVSSGDINCHHLVGEPCLHHSDRRNQIGIATDHNEVIAPILVCVPAANLDYGDMQNCTGPGIAQRERLKSKPIIQARPISLTNRVTLGEKLTSCSYRLAHTIHRRGSWGLNSRKAPPTRKSNLITLSPNFTPFWLSRWISSAFVRGSVSHRPEIAPVRKVIPKMRKKKPRNLNHQVAPGVKPTPNWGNPVTLPIFETP